MGLSITQANYVAEDYARYSTRLYECLAALKLQLRQPGFGSGQQKIGAELECYIVDAQGAPLPLNQELINAAKSPLYTVELNRFNLEINAEPIAVHGHAFSELEQQLKGHLAKLRALAEPLGAQVVPIGILPTLRADQLGSEQITDCVRYRVLSQALRSMRGEDFHIAINGEESLSTSCDQVTLEGANTSFQFHLMVSPDQFADVFNAVQLTQPLVTAVAANSPVFLGKKLWDETRIALFKQSIDSRSANASQWREPARVAFGYGWVREDAWELFAESVALYPPIFPILSEQAPMAALEAGRAPDLAELGLHMGTTWPWNRPVYSAQGSGHIRIEMRALPAGPTCADMCANAAFAAGLAIGLQRQVRDRLAVLPFRFAEYNFYRAAQRGLAADLIWPDKSNHRLTEQPLVKVLETMLPVAEQGLSHLGIAPAEINRYLSMIVQRLERNITGASWQRNTLESLASGMSRQGACQAMFARYCQYQLADRPIHEWPLSC